MNAFDDGPGFAVWPQGLSEADVSMRPLLVHASSKATERARRRVLHIEYAASLRLEQDLELDVA